MGGGIKIGRLFGIEIAIHPTWFIILVVVTWSLASSEFPNHYAWSKPTYWIVERSPRCCCSPPSSSTSWLTHWLRDRRVCPCKSITLFLMGGVSTIEKEPSGPGREAVLAGIGPLSSLVLGGLFVGASLVVKTPQTIHATLSYLGYINIALAVFNILPGFPLDGGRVLRAVLWSRSHDFERATRGASRAGHVFGYP